MSGRNLSVRTAAIWRFVLAWCEVTAVFTVTSVTVAEPAKVEQVVVVFKTHFDIGYTDLARNVVNSYRTSMIDKALDVCEGAKSMPTEQRFVWTVPGWPMAQILWPGQSPERRQRILQAIRDGRLVWHGLPFTPHTESLDLEDVVRGMEFSSALSRSLGMPLPRDAKMTDVPSHTRIVPTILKRAGIDFLHIGCNPQAASADVPALFWWEGPDGSRLLTMYSAGDYGTGLKAPEGWPYKTWLALIHTGDNEGPPTPQAVQALVDQAKRELPGVKLRFGRLSDFADAILKENPPLPVVCTDMPDTWIYGIAAMPCQTALARHLRPQIGTLESLNALLTIWGVKVPEVKNVVADAYEGSLMYGEHTWGYCMGFLGWRYGREWEEARDKGRYALAEESWAEKGEKILNAERLVHPALQRDVAALAQAVRVTGRRIIVFNPLPWRRDGLVNSDWSKTFLADDTGAIPMTLRDVATGDTITAEIDGPWARFIARDVPPLGYRTYVPVGEQAKQPESPSSGDDTTLENEYLRVQLDPARGTVASLIDKRSGRELVDPTSKYGFGQYLYERFDADMHHAYQVAYCKSHPWPAWAEVFGKPHLPPAKESPYAAASPKNFRISTYRGPVASMAVMNTEAGEAIPHDVRVIVTLCRGCPFIDVGLTISAKRADPWPEAGWLCFPFKIEKPTFQLGRLGATMDPAKDICRGTNHEVFCLSSGMTALGPDGAGAGLCPIDSPLVSLGHPGLFRYTKNFTPREPIAFVNLYNNQWGTNFQQWIDKLPPFSVRIWAVRDGSTQSNLVTPSWEARQPCLATLFDGPAGELPPTQSGIELSQKGVLVTAFGPNPDGDGTLLRLWEQAGEDGPCQVRLPEGLSAVTAQSCDLRGQAQGEPLPVHGSEVTLPLRHFAPASVILRKQK
jgi:alpha-mannosidase